MPSMTRLVDQELRKMGLLYERARSRVECDAFDLRLAREHLDVLRERALLRPGRQVLGNARPHLLERERAAGNAAHDLDHVEAEARRHEARQNADVELAEDGTVELRRHLATAELPEIAALRAGRTVRQLARALGEERSAGDQLGERLLGACAQRGDRRPWGNREQDVPRLDQLAGVEALGVSVEVAPALGLGRDRN